MKRADYEQALEAASALDRRARPLPPPGRVGAPGARAADHTDDQAALGLGQLMREAAGSGHLGPQGDAWKACRLELLCTLRRAREELGRWPTAGEWEFATNEHPSRRSYTRHFGSWRRACRMAARVRL